MSREQDDRNLSTADLLAGTEAPQHEDRQLERDAIQQAEPMQARAGGTAMNDEPLAALFDTDVAQGFHQRWNEVQIGFVDDPRQAVKQADELVAQVMKSLAESFSKQRASIEADVGGSDQASTENLRVALRRYRSFFERLLSL